MKSLYLLRALSLPVLAAVIAALPLARAAASSWTVEVVDAEGDVGSYTSLVIDAQDRPVVAYRDERFRTARIKRKSAGGWGHAVVPPDPSANFGQWNALAADDAGGLQLVYVQMPDFWLRHTSFDGSSWSSIEDVFIGGFYADIEIDSQGTPHVGYVDWPGGFPAYSTSAGGPWSTDLLTFDNAAYSSLALDSNDVPHLAYRRLGYTPPDALVLAALQPDGTWDQVDALTSPPTDPAALSLAIDAADRIHIAYHDQLSGQLMYYLNDGTDVTHVVIDPSLSVGNFVSMEVDDALVPHVAYYMSLSGDLRYVRGDDWAPVVVDSTGDVGQYASLALDSQGMPHIAYYDATNGNLKHAWASPPTAATVAADREDGFSARPNPFHGADGVEISLALPRSAPVELGVYDIQGRLIRTLIRRTMDPGNHQVHWDGRRDTGQELPAGVYFLRLRGHGAVRGERIVKIR